MKSPRGNDGIPDGVDDGEFVTNYTYNDAGQVTLETVGGSAQYHFTITRMFNDRGNLREETDGGGLTTKHFYDALGHLTESWLPNPATGLFDGGKLVVSHKYRDGKRWQTYDARENAQQAPEATEVLTYDRLDRLTAREVKLLADNESF